MTQETFWRDAARGGAIIGLLLSASFVVEYSLNLFTAGMGMKIVQQIISFGVFALHYYLLHRFTRNRAALYPREDGFTFMQGYAFIQTVSALSGLIVGCTNFIYIHLFLGYDRFVELSSKALAELATQSGDNALTATINQAIALVHEAEEPTLIDTLFGSVLSGWLYGAVFGLIIAGVISRRPQLFDNRDNDQSHE